jgi:hypothetical protein
MGASPGSSAGGLEPFAARNAVVSAAECANCRDRPLEGSLPLQSPPGRGRSVEAVPPFNDARSKRNRKLASLPRRPRSSRHAGGSPPRFGRAAPPRNLIPHRSRSGKHPRFLQRVAARWPPGTAPVGACIRCGGVPPRAGWRAPAGAAMPPLRARPRRGAKLGRRRCRSKNGLGGPAVCVASPHGAEQKRRCRTLRAIPVPAACGRGKEALRRTRGRSGRAGGKVRGPPFDCQYSAEAVYMLA